MKRASTYSVVIYKTGELIRSGLLHEAAQEFCRDWNSRATPMTWCRVRSESLKPAAAFAADLRATLPTLVEGVPVDELCEALHEDEQDQGFRLETVFLPSPAEIAAEAAKIRSEWSEVERISRQRELPPGLRTKLTSNPTLRWGSGTEREPHVHKCHLSRKGSRAA